MKIQCVKNGECRWSRLVKRQPLNESEPTEAVQKLLQMNYLKEADVAYLSGSTSRVLLNPALTIEMRHKKIDCSVRQTAISPKSNPIMRIKMETIDKRKERYMDLLLKKEIDEMRKSFAIQKMSLVHGSTYSYKELGDDSLSLEPQIGKSFSINTFSQDVPSPVIVQSLYAEPIQEDNPKFDFESCMANIFDPPTVSSEVDPAENASDVEVIEKPERTEEEDKIMKIHLRKWAFNAMMARINRKYSVNKDSQLKHINAFVKRTQLHKLRLEKKHKTTSEKLSDSVKPNVLLKKYESRIKLQEDIIDVQNQRLERQRQLISDLKFNKIRYETDVAKEKTNADIQGMISTQNVNLRGKVRCLKMIANVKNEDDADQNRLKAFGCGLSRFLVQMQERTSQMNSRHVAARERRLALDAQKEAMRIAGEEAKKLADEEEKKARIAELRTKRRREKQQKELDKIARLKYRSDVEKADNFYRKTLLQRYGIRMIGKYVRMRHELDLKARTHFKAVTLRRALRTWNEFYCTIWKLKLEKAKDCYRIIMKRQIFCRWLSFHNMEMSKVRRAVQWNAFRLSGKIFNCWLLIHYALKEEETLRIHKAHSHFEWNLTWRCFNRWTRLSSILEIEKETEQRRQRWRAKVWDVLPDYRPRTNED